MCFLTLVEKHAWSIGKSYLYIGRSWSNFNVPGTFMYVFVGFKRKMGTYKCNIHWIYVCLTCSSYVAFSLKKTKGVFTFILYVVKTICTYEHPHVDATLHISPGYTPHTIMYQL